MNELPNAVVASNEELKKLLLDRRNSDSKPGRRKDGKHIALVIEGGGMRGSAAGGMVSGLEALGLRDSFDSVHGSSAGAAAGAYFVVGRAASGTTLFYEDINNSQFIDVWRSLRGRAIMDTSFLVDHAMVQCKPMDYPTLHESDVPLHVVCTDIDKHQSHMVSRFRDYDHYRAILKASIAMPFIAGDAPTIDGKRLLDGGLLQQLAIDSAIGSGATHVLVLMTRRVDEMIRPGPTAKTKAEAWFLQRMYGGKIGDLFYHRNDKINFDVERILSGSVNSIKIGCFPLPFHIRDVHRLTKDTAILKRSAETCCSEIQSWVTN